MFGDITIRKLSLYQFKCYTDSTFDFREKIVCLLGENGTGKTNLLDAIYYLCFSKSYFNHIDSQNVHFDHDQAAISGSFLRDGVPEEITCAIRKGQRKILKRNHREYERMSDHIGLLPAVLITPYDIELILEGSEVRRKFLDATLSQSSPGYLQHLVGYNQALQQRNNLLKQLSKKSGDMEDVLEPWDMQLAHRSAEIYRERKLFFDIFLPLFTATYTAISGKREIAAIAYESDLDIMGMKELLLKNRDRDRMTERTTAGIHRDDLLFTLNGYPIKKFASQGQQKSFLIALKLAQFQFLKKVKQIHPMLMLDDLFDKLDEMRVANLLAWISSQRPGQIFITDTDLHRIPALLNQLHLPFETWKIEQYMAKKINK